MSYTIHLSEAQYIILQDLINRGMDEALAPFDNIRTNELEELMISNTLAAVAFFNSHLPD